MATPKPNNAQPQRVDMQVIYRRRRVAFVIAVLVIIAFVVACVTVVPRWMSSEADAANAREAAQIAANESSTDDASDSSDSSSDSASTSTKNTLDTQVTHAIQALQALDGTSELAASGFKLSDESTQLIEEQIQTFAAAGYTMSFAIVDIHTGNAMTSYGSTSLYSASAIKGPYIMSLAATDAIDLDSVYAATHEANAQIKTNIEAIAEASDNDAYVALHNEYGTTPFNSWLSEQNIHVDEEVGSYADISAVELASMWVEAYGYLFDDDTESQSAADNSSVLARAWLADEFGNSLNSSINAALADTHTVLTKAGWINGEGDLYALNDGGIVTSAEPGTSLVSSDNLLTTRTNDYALAILTNACGRNDLLASLAATLNDIHDADMTTAA